MKELTVIVIFRRPEEGGHSLMPKRLLESRMYRPHFIVENPGAAAAEEYLGVCFREQEGALEPGKECSAKVLLMYEGIDYSKLESGTCFRIVEGQRVVGAGRVQ